VLQRFISTYAGQEFQIVSLGAGYDSTYFWIRDLVEDDRLPKEVAGNLKYIEVDYQDVVDKKIKAIRASEKLVKHIWPDNIVNEGEIAPGTLNNAQYKIVAGDLR
jgi:O-methyltransferase involved in polyketide biosynthesis